MFNQASGSQSKRKRESETPPHAPKDSRPSSSQGALQGKKLMLGLSSKTIVDFHRALIECNIEKVLWFFRNYNFILREHSHILVDDTPIAHYLLNFTERKADLFYTQYEQLLYLLAKHDPKHLESVNKNNVSVVCRIVALKRVELFGKLLDNKLIGDINRIYSSQETLLSVAAFVNCMPIFDRILKDVQLCALRLSPEGAYRGDIVLDALKGKHTFVVRALREISPKSTWGPVYKSHSDDLIGPIEQAIIDKKTDTAIAIYQHHSEGIQSISNLTRLAHICSKHLSGSSMIVLKTFTENTVPSTLPDWYIKAWQNSPRPQDVLQLTVSQLKATSPIIEAVISIARLVPEDVNSETILKRLRHNETIKSFEQLLCLLPKFDGLKRSALLQFMLGVHLGVEVAHKKRGLYGTTSFLSCISHLLKSSLSTTAALKDYANNPYPHFQNCLPRNLFCSEISAKTVATEFELPYAEGIRMNASMLDITVPKAICVDGNQKPVRDDPYGVGAARLLTASMRLRLIDDQFNVCSPDFNSANSYEIFYRVAYPYVKRELDIITERLTRHEAANLLFMFYDALTSNCAELNAHTNAPIDTDAPAVYKAFTSMDSPCMTLTALNNGAPEEKKEGNTLDYWLFRMAVGKYVLSALSSMRKLYNDTNPFYGYTSELFLHLKSNHCRDINYLTNINMSFFEEGHATHIEACLSKQAQFALEWPVNSTPSPETSTSSAPETVTPKFRYISLDQLQASISYLEAAAARLKRISTLPTPITDENILFSYNGAHRTVLAAALEIAPPQHAPERKSVLKPRSH